ncbi:hypothetical protein IC582_023848 [Cucumis melo]|nr:putative pentatricopeptide repeat-containing protein At4g17915 [Cucumis melo]KAA0032156.1 putative pentatricopeptide repeat-containing protein [Cucumis melo var. makuwa]TYK14401.1 putative pentatricopeptide repeat-containing protein [Cucumis melo var. makuwa]
MQKAEIAITDAIRLGVLPNVVTYNFLIHGYCQFRCMDAAYSVLYRMREASISPNVITYNSLIAAATKNGSLEQSLNLFEEMLQLGITPDALCYTTLMQCYNKMVKPDEANRVFEGIPLCIKVTACLLEKLKEG